MQNERTMVDVGIPYQRKEVDWQTKEEKVRTDFYTGTCLNLITELELQKTSLDNPQVNTAAFVFYVDVKHCLTLKEKYKPTCSWTVFECSVLGTTLRPKTQHAIRTSIKLHNYTLYNLYPS
jgi:hypothetical protein